MSVPPSESLAELLARLHERLSQVQRMEPETRAQLTALTRDIQRALSQAEQPGAAAQIDQESLPRLEALAVRFEAVHPAFAQALRQLIDLLGKAGI
jgi:Domain of unknown function (DUF4404)